MPAELDEADDADDVSRETDRRDDSPSGARYRLSVVDTPGTLPAFVNWPSFPFEGQLRIKHLDPPAPVEPPRDGEDPESCAACNAPDDAYIWVSERWRVRALDGPTGLPMVLILETRSHLDVGDLPNLLAAEMGVMTVRLERAIRSLDGVARVHVNRWGDGAAHLHLWFLARPVGQLQLRGSFLSMWDDILEPIPESQWRESLSMVAAWLGEFGGRVFAEPPRIEWLAPSKFQTSADVVEAPTDEAADASARTPADATADTSARTPADATADTSAHAPAEAGESPVAIGQDAITPPGELADAEPAEQHGDEAGTVELSRGMHPRDERTEEADETVTSWSVPFDPKAGPAEDVTERLVPRQAASDESMTFLSDLDLDMSKMR